MNFYNRNNGFDFNARQTGPAGAPVEADRLVKSMLRCQLEIWGLASRRAQAMLSLPEQLAKCRTPTDLARINMEFWRTAFEQGADSAHRMSEHLQGRAHVPVSAPAELRSEEPPAKRDIIDLAPPSKSDRREKARDSNRARGERRVA